MLATVSIATHQAQAPQVHRHILGFTFQLPTGWSVKEREGTAIRLQFSGQGQEAHAIQIEPTAVKELLDEATVNDFRNLINDGWEIATEEKRSVKLGESAYVLLRKHTSEGSAWMSLQWAITGGVRCIVVGGGPEAVRVKRDAALQKIFASLTPTTRTLTAQEKKLQGEWTTKLRGARLVKSSAQTSGGGAGFGSMSSRTFYVLDGSGAYQYDHKSIVSVDVPGLSSSHGDSDQDEGKWSVLVLGSQVCLRLDSAKGGGRLAELKAQGSRVLVDGVLYDVSR